MESANGKPNKNYKENKFRFVTNVPKALDNMSVLVHLRKEYKPNWPESIVIKYTYARDNDSPRLRFSIPDKAKNGMYWLSIAEPKSRNKALIKVPVAKVSGDVIKWVYSQKWFNALKFTLYSHYMRLEQIIPIHDLSKQLEILLSEMLVQQEVLKMDDIKKGIIDVVLGLRGLKVIEYNKDRNLYILKGVFDIPVDMKSLKKVNFSIHIEYAVGISGDMITGAEKELLDEFDSFIVETEGDNSTEEYEIIPDYHVEVLKSIFLRIIHKLNC